MKLTAESLARMVDLSAVRTDVSLAEQLKLIADALPGAAQTALAK